MALLQQEVKVLRIMIVGAGRVGKLKVPQEVMFSILGFFALYIVFYLLWPHW